MQERIEESLRLEMAQYTRRKVRADTVYTLYKNNGELYEASHYVCLPESVNPRAK